MSSPIYYSINAGVVLPPINEGEQGIEDPDTLLAPPGTRLELSNIFGNATCCSAGCFIIAEISLIATMGTLGYMEVIPPSIGGGVILAGLFLTSAVPALFGQAYTYFRTPLTPVPPEEIVAVREPEAEPLDFLRIQAFAEEANAQQAQENPNGFNHLLQPLLELPQLLPGNN